MKILKTAKYKKMAEFKYFSPGDKAKISDLSGIDSGKIVTIIHRSNIKTDGRGTPTNVQGAYQPVDWNEEEAFQYEDGSFGTMFKNRLTKVKEDISVNSVYPQPD